MTLKGNHNHYNVKFLKGYGHSISVKNSKIVFKDCHDPFSEPSQEEWFVKNMPYEKIVLSGKGYISTEALSLLSENNRNVILIDTYGKPVTFCNGMMDSLTATKYRMAQYDTFRNESKCQYLAKQVLNAKIKSQLEFLKSIGSEVTSLPEKEHLTSKIYFREFVNFIPEKYGFESRNQSQIRNSKNNATDSVCVTRKVNVDSDELGEFSFEKYAEDVYYLQNGFYRFKKWKLRGLGKLGRNEIEHIDTIEKDGRLYYQYKVLRTKKLASAIIQNKIDDIGRIKEETREVNLNGDDKRFWLGRLENINDDKMNNSMPLNPEFFPEKFELNDDFHA